MKAKFYGELQVLSAFDTQGWLTPEQQFSLAAGLQASAALGWQPPPTER